MADNAALAVGIGYAAVGIGFALVGAAQLLHRQGRARPAQIATVASEVFLGIGFVTVGALKLATLTRSAAGNPETPMLSPVTPKEPRLGETLRDAATRADGAIHTQEFKRVDSIGERIAILRDLAKRGSEHPRIIEMTRAVLGRKCGPPGSQSFCVPEKDGKAEAVALFNAIRDPNSPYAVRYVRDHATIDQYQHPAKTLQLRTADCDDYSSLVAAVLRASGFQHVKYRVVQARGAPDWSHIYVVVGIPAGQPTKWLSLDASMDKPAGWEADKTMVVRRKDFEV